MLSMASTCSPINFLIASCMRTKVVIFYHHSIIHGHGVRLLTSTFKVSLIEQDSYMYFAIFLAVMASHHTFMNYNSSGHHNRTLHLLAWFTEIT